jgi:ribokinase
MPASRQLGKRTGRLPSAKPGFPRQTTDLGLAWTLTDRGYAERGFRFYPMIPKVVVVGSFVQDLMWKCPAFPAAGETVIGTFVSGPGGKGSNQAIAAGRAGVPTVFVGAVGADLFAEGAKAFYRSEGIGVRLAVKPAHATGTAAILVNGAGENEIVVALGANEHLSPRDVDPALFRSAKVVLCQQETNSPLNAHVFRLARRAGVMTVLNPAPMRTDFDPALLRHTDVLIPNESEFVALVNLLPSCERFRRTRGAAFDVAALEQMALADLGALCRTLGVPTVIVTQGRRGCFVARAGGAGVSIPAHRGVKVADTSGAGDAFVGGFAAGLVQFGGDLVAAARHGNAVAALSVTKFGTAPSMPTAVEIRRFLAQTSRRGPA